MISNPSVNSNWSYSPETINSRQNQQFFVRCDLEIWQMTMKNNRAPFLYYIKLYACIISSPYVNSNWSYGPEAVKRSHGFCDLDLWPLTLTFCTDITFVNRNNSWKFQYDTMTGTLSKRCDRRTDRQTEISVLRAAWSQLKTTPVVEIFISQFSHHLAQAHSKLSAIPGFIRLCSKLREFYPNW